ncbi:Hypothetical predicted protein, partial [Paramuricea clavata]
ETSANPDWSLVSGALTQLDISPDDILWGVNSADNIYIRNGSGWSQVGGALKHVTVGKAGVWGVNAGRNIYYRNGVTLSNPKGSSWTRIPGSLIQIDSGPSGIVYGVNRHRQIYCRKGISLSRPTGTTWVRVGGALKYVSCGVYGCWGVNSAGQIWFRYGVTPNNCAGKKWVRISGGLIELEFLVTGYSKIVALESTGAIYDYGGDWPIIPGSLKQIDHGLSTAVWGVNRHDAIYRLKNDKLGWQRIAGALTHVSAGEAGIWGVNGYEHIYYRIGVTENNPSGTSWKLIPGKLKQIDSGPSGIVYGVNIHDQIYCRTGIEYGNPFGTGWKQVTSYGRLKYVSCGVLGCWGVNSTDGIWYRSGITKENCVGAKWHDIPGKLKQIEVGAAGDVYGINSAGNVYRRSGISELRPMGSGWQRIQENGSHITTGLNGLYLLINGQIHYSSGCPGRSP